MSECRKLNSRMINIKDQRFGRLVALYPTVKSNHNGSVCWHCRCDCGGEIDVAVDPLKNGVYLSCGCLKKENQKNIFGKLHLVDGTCIEWLEKRKSRSDNTSGFRGVSQMKNGRYRAGIGFKQQRFHLGTYKTYEEAVDSRLAAEKLIHDGFLKAYYQWSLKAEQDPDWAQQHPFTYDIERIDGQWIIKKTQVR